nr:MAG: hypothetical protein [Lokiarchaeota virus Skoll Meg22_1214]
MILSQIFDRFINELLLFWKEQGEAGKITFEDLYLIFRRMGLKKVYPKTFDKLAGALQWKIIPLEFVNVGFLRSYQEGFLSLDVRESIDDLVDIALILKREKEREEEIELDG